ncbi:TetR/AcrR family transcriptional regulator [Marinactinospora thermotolerans]|uniref:Transcriptional regulator, TetR family n=1 Tax=Marinactinospora thermotolerans DSM 45154 TaxID=1122192 RepID=A0A1T4PA63_9ACTN|nr:TetR/AcrR family transcriptional regulator [Marinactinospora thermotolerans]SJZ88281.1 transcriptional regulator, TetR family [Marinactinospora thermotolerans DSM 45154]
MDADPIRERVLDAADALFYQQGIQAVGMDAIRARAEVSLKRLYQCFPAKEALVAAYLRRRDERWITALTDFVENTPATTPRVCAVFDFLAAWFATPGFRGCAFVNAFGELGAVSPLAVQALRSHKERLRTRLVALARRDGVADPESAAAHLLFLVDGAIVAASAGTVADPAGTAREAALRVVTAG